MRRLAVWIVPVCCWMRWVGVSGCCPPVCVLTWVCMALWCWMRFTASSWLEIESLKQTRGCIGPAGTPGDERVSGLHDYVIALERRLKPEAPGVVGEGAG